MPYLRERLRKGLRLHIVVFEVLAFILGMSVIALTQQPATVWLLGVAMIPLHTILFYRLGKVSERLRAEADARLLPWPEARPYGAPGLEDQRGGADFVVARLSVAAAERLDASAHGRIIA